MDTLKFFQTILPDDGVYFLALFKEGYKAPAHKAYTDLALMAQAVEQMAKSNQLTVYHACASYIDPVVEVQTEDGIKRKYRISENWNKAKAFWVDIDCGQEKFDSGDGYLRKRDAFTAICAFCVKIGWPQPMVVDSGNGLHAYWPLVKPIRSELWRRVASALKSCLAHEGVIADPTRTADFSSILRPVGGVNRKYGGAKNVTVIKECEPVEAKVLAEALHQYVVANSVKVLKDKPAVSVNPNASINADLIGLLPQYPNTPVDANVMADKCAQVAAMRDTQGDVGYEHWRGVIGLLKHCVEGEAYAEQWSDNREASGHSQINWHDKYSTWSSGPTTCEFFEKCNPSGCSGCEFKDKVKTPLVLGRVAPINEDTTETIVTDEGEEHDVAVPAIADGYQWEPTPGILSRLLPDKDGVLQVFPFSHLLFYPVSRIKAEDGTYRIGMRMHLPSKRVRDFEMSSESMASQTDMLRSMARYELFQSNHKNSGTHMAAYLREQLESLKRKVEETSTLSSYGWKSDNSEFLLADRLYQKDGSFKRVLVSGGALKYSSTFSIPKSATIQKYAKALNDLYNYEGKEQFQYALVSGWGSILSPFAGEELYHGLILAMQGGKSGKGKTTVSYASMYAFGNAVDMSINTKDGFTTNALWAVMATFNSLPVLIDELTNMDAKVFSDIAYGVANGKEKIRLVAPRNGQLNFANTMTWSLSAFVTGNRDFHGLLAMAQANSQAEAVRLIQLNMDRYPVIDVIASDKPRELMTKEEIELINQQEAAFVQHCVDTMKANRGVAGEAIVKYVLANRSDVQKEVRAISNELVKYVPDPKFRFYRAHVACALTMASITKSLGIIDFDLDRLKKFCVELLMELTNTVQTLNTVTTEDAFSRMVAVLAPRIITTVEFRDGRHKDGPETPRARVFGEVCGRYVLGSKTKMDHAGHIMINQKDARDWCMQNRVDYNDMVEHLQEVGALIARGDKVCITRGTDMPTIQARCLIVDTHKLDGTGLSLVVDNTQPLVADNAVGDV